MIDTLPSNTSVRPIDRNASPSDNDCRSWIAAALIVIGLPILALTTTKYILLPPVQRSLSAAQVSDPNAHPYMERIHFNGSIRAAGIGSVAMLSDSSMLKKKISTHQTRIAEIARKDLEGVTSEDLYRSEKCEAVRTRLLVDINRAIGGPMVKEVYIALTLPN